MGSYDEDDRQQEWTGEASAYDDALVPVNEGAHLPPSAPADETGPLVIPGTGISMGDPFIKRRERPLTLRLAALALMACILVTGLFSVLPLDSEAAGTFSPFETLSSAVVWNQSAGYFWYTTQPGDTLDSLAKKFNVQVGGILKLNNLLAGQELSIGIAYKIPTDSKYGQDYRPPSYVPPSLNSNGKTVFGSTLWTSYAGDPNPEMPCAPNGNGNPAGYKLISPLPGSIWNRGFSWYHNGVDLDAPAGTPELAAQAGQVIWTGWDTGGFGYSVKINHCNHVSTMYGHMAKILVQTGQAVQAGDIIGLEGATGLAQGFHLHFGVEWDNQFVDPLTYYGNSIYNITHA